MRFSIVIPTYEYKGKYSELLDKCIGSIDKQTFKDYEIVISDHSVTDVIEQYLKKWDLPIRYIKNEIGRGNSSINMNVGIKNSAGEYIKILHMDDWFCDTNSLQYINDSLINNTMSKWGSLGFNHYYEARNITEYNVMPHINRELRTILGCPSVSFFINNKEDPVLYDENLIIINDSDMHIRLGKKYGNPILINKICVTIRMHENQVSNLVSEQKHQWEIQYYRDKNFKDMIWIN